MRFNEARVETGGRGSQGLGVGFCWYLSRGDGWFTRRVKWGKYVVEFGRGELWEQGILKEGLGGRKRDDTGEW